MHHIEDCSKERVELDSKIERLEDKLDNFKDDIRGDIHIIDKNIEVFMNKVDNHIQEEAETIRELQGLAAVAPALKQMIEGHQRQQIVASERSKRRSEVFKKAKLYSALGGALTTLFTAIYYGLKVKGML